jgi:hypothetical protein
MSSTGRRSPEYPEAVPTQRPGPVRARVWVRLGMTEDNVPQEWRESVRRKLTVLLAELEQRRRASSLRSVMRRDTSAGLPVTSAWVAFRSAVESAQVAWGTRPSRAGLTVRGAFGSADGLGSSLTVLRLAGFLLWGSANNARGCRNVCRAWLRAEFRFGSGYGVARSGSFSTWQPWRCTIKSHSVVITRSPRRSCSSEFRYCQSGCCGQSRRLCLSEAAVKSTGSWRRPGWPD